MSKEWWQESPQEEASGFTEEVRIVQVLQRSPDDIAAALAGIRSRLDILASITASNILIPGGPQSRYHQIVEEAYAVLGLIETQIDELRTELEYQHERLGEIRDAALAEQEQRS